MELEASAEKIRCILNRLEQGPVTETELDRLLKEATCSSVKTEREYLSRVLSTLYPTVKLPPPECSTSSAAGMQQHQQQLDCVSPLSDATNKQHHQQPAAGPLHSQHQKTPQKLQQFHASTTAAQKGEAATPAAHRAETISSSSAVGGQQVVATTEQLAAMITAATTAATKAVARTILHHTRSARGQNHLLQGSCLQHDRSGTPAEDAATAASEQQQQPGREKQQQQQQQELRGQGQEHGFAAQSRLQLQPLRHSVGPPAQKLLKYAGPQQENPPQDAGPQQENLLHDAGWQQDNPPQHSLQKDSLSIPTPMGSAVEPATGTTAGKVVVYPRIWVQPAQPQQTQQLQEDADNAIRLRPSRTRAHNSSAPAAGVAAAVEVAAADSVHINAAPPTESTAAGGLTGVAALEACALASSVQAAVAAVSQAASTALAAAQRAPALDGTPAPCSSAIEPDADASPEAHQEAEAPITAPADAQMLPAAAGPEPGAAKQLQGQKPPPPKFQQPTKPGRHASRRQQEQLQGHSPAQQLHQQPEPVVPKPVPLPAELKTAVERTLQNLKVAPKPYSAVVVTPTWHRQQEPDEATRVAQQLLGGQFDYSRALQQLTDASQAVQIITDATASTSGRQTKMTTVLPPPAAGVQGIVQPAVPAAVQVTPALQDTAGQLSDADSIRSSTAVGTEVSGGAAAVGSGHAARAAATPEADETVAAAWPGVLCCDMSPLARFYDEEDAWQDISSFNKAIEREVSWRLAAADAVKADSRPKAGRSSSKAVSWAALKKSQAGAATATAAATPTKTVPAPIKAAAPPAALPPTTAPARSQATTAAAAETGTALLPVKSPSKSRDVELRSDVCRKSPAKADRVDAAAAAGRASASATAAAVGVAAGQASNSLQRPVVAFGRRVEKPLPAPSLMRKHLPLYSRSSSVSAAAAARGLRPAQQLPCFDDFGAMTNRRGGSRRAAGAAAAAVAGRASATAAALQRLSQRRRAAAAAAPPASVGADVLADVWHSSDDAAAVAAAPAVQQVDSAANGPYDVLDVLLDALLEAGLENQQWLTGQQQASAQQLYSSTSSQSPAQATEMQQPPEGCLATTTALEDAAKLAVGRTTSGRRELAAVYDITQPPQSAAADAQQRGLCQAQQALHQSSAQYGGVSSPTAVAAAAADVADAPDAAAAAAGDPEGEMMDLLVDAVMGQLLVQRAAAKATFSTSTLDPTFALHNTAAAAGEGNTAGAASALNVLPPKLLRELVTEEIAAALEKWDAEEAGAVTGPRQQNTHEHAAAVAAAQTQQVTQEQGTSPAGEMSPAAAAAAKQQLAAACDESSREGATDDEALLHALTEALISTCGGMSALQNLRQRQQQRTGATAAAAAPHNVTSACTSSAQAVDTPSHVVRDDATACAPGSSNAAAAAGSRKASKHQKPGFGQLPGLAQAKKAAVSVRNGRHGSQPPQQQQQQGCVASLPRSGQQPTYLGVGESETAFALSNQVEQQQQQQQEEEEAEGSIVHGAQSTPAVSAPAAAAASEAGAVSRVLTAGNAGGQQGPQPAYVLLPVHMMQNMQQQQQQQQAGALPPPQQDQNMQEHFLPYSAAAAAAAACADLARDGSRPAASGPDYSMATFPVAAAAAGYPGHGSTAIGVPVLHNIGVQQQQQYLMHPAQPICCVLPGLQQPDRDMQPRAVQQAAVIADDWHRCSLPGSEYFRDSLDTSSSSSSSGNSSSHCQQQQQHVHAEPLAATHNPARNKNARAAQGPPWLQQTSSAVGTANQLEAIEVTAVGSTVPYTAVKAVQAVQPAPAEEQPQADRCSQAESYTDDFEAEGELNSNQQQLQQKSATQQQLQQQQQQQQDKCRLPEQKPASFSGSQTGSSSSSSQESSALEVPSNELQDFVVLVGRQLSQTASTSSTTAAADESMAQLNLANVEQQEPACAGSAHVDNVTSSLPETALGKEQLGAEGHVTAAAAAHGAHSAVGKQDTDHDDLIGDVQLPELLELSSSSSSGSAGGEGPQQEHQLSASVRLWRPAAGATAGTSQRMPLSGQDMLLLRLPLRNAAASTPPATAAAAAAAAAQPLLPSPSFSSVLGVDTSTATLTSLSSSTSSGSGSSSNSTGTAGDSLLQANSKFLRGGSCSNLSSITSESSSSSSSLSTLESVLQGFGAFLAGCDCASPAPAAAAGKRVSHAVAGVSNSNRTRQYAAATSAVVQAVLSSRTGSEDSAADDEAASLRRQRLQQLARQQSTQHKRSQHHRCQQQQWDVQQQQQQYQGQHHPSTADQHERSPGSNDGCAPSGQQAVGSSIRTHVAHASSLTAWQGLSQSAGSSGGSEGSTSAASRSRCSAAGCGGQQAEAAAPVALGAAGLVRFAAHR